MIYIRLGLIVVLVLDPLIIFQMIVAIGFMASSMNTSNFFILFCIFPYAVMTLHNKSGCLGLPDLTL